MHAMQDTTHAHLSYEKFLAIAPAATKALQDLGNAVGDTSLDKKLIELVKLRVSQINGCAFCTQYHLDLARRLTVETVKLDLLAVWRDAGVFSSREMAALDWAEHLARMLSAVVPDDAYVRLREAFSENEAVHLTVAIANINAWNRIAGALRFPPQGG